MRASASDAKSANSEGSGTTSMLVRFPQMFLLIPAMNSSS